MATVQISDDVARIQERFDAVRAEVGKVLVGQDMLVQRLQLALLADGHILLEGVPGLAKTLTVSTPKRAFRASSSRLTCCPAT